MTTQFKNKKLYEKDNLINIWENIVDNIYGVTYPSNNSDSYIDIEEGKNLLKVNQYDNNGDILNSVSVIPNNDGLYSRKDINDAVVKVVNSSANSNDYHLTDNANEMFLNDDSTKVHGMRKGTGSKVAKKTDKEYNRFSSKLTSKEINQIVKEVMTWRVNQENGLHYIDLSVYGYKSYIYNKQGISIVPIKKVEGSQEFLNKIRKEIENGVIKETKTINKWITTVEHETKNDRSSDASLSNGRSNNRDAQIYSRTIEKQQTSNRAGTVKQNNRNGLGDKFYR